MHVARRFESLLDAHCRPDGSRWTGQQLDDATGGVVTRSYVTNLRKGRIENPGMDKLAALAKAMGFPPTLWFEEELPGTDGRGAAGIPTGLAGRVEHLFDVIKDPKTGEAYTSAKVARMSLGDLREEDVEGIRGGSVADPPLSQVVALARAFGVEPSYLVDGTGEAVLDREVVEALGVDMVRAIAKECARLPNRERQLILGIVRQLEGARPHEEADSGAPSGGR